jgi:multidrug transporter EmrE-like cation transporter
MSTPKYFSSSLAICFLDSERFAVHDGDVIRTTVFFKGCPLRCVWCHNPEGLSRAPRTAFYEHKCIGWGALYALDFSFEPKVLIYSLLFGIFYALHNVGVINALKSGPATLTSLFVGLSLLLTSVWGFFFWNEPVTIPVVVGLLLVVVSIFLCLYSKKKDEKSISLKWIFFIALAFFSNAGCAIAQRSEQLDFDGAHGKMMMFFAILLSVIFYLLLFFIRSNKKDLTKIVRTSGWVPSLAGFINVAHNLIILFLATTPLSASLIYPVIGVGSLAVVTIFSLFVFKEKMQWWQWLGVAIGAVAVVLLSI